MNRFDTMTKLLSAGAIALVLQACGGGSAESAPAPNPQAPPPATGTPAPVPTPTPTPTPEPTPEPAPDTQAGSVVPPAPGGFKESPLLADPRPRLASAEVGSFLPTSRGPFTFPAPYNTRGARITIASDCGGSDCVQSVGYSYWRNINNHVNDDVMYIFAGLNASEGGTGPTLFSFNKVTEKVEKVGPLFDEGSKFYNATGEGWYFSATLPNALYVRDGAKLVRYDVISKTTEQVFDATTKFGSGHEIWQVHSSNDDRVHSATLRTTGDFKAKGCMVFSEDTGEFRLFDKKGSFDECQIDKSGRFLVIKENVDGQAGEDNRIVDLETGKERLLKDEDGAAGHSDLGYASMVAADNHNAEPDVQRVWDFLSSSLDGPLAYRGRAWGTGGVPNHVSFANARDDVPLTDQYACGSSASAKTNVHANEIICFLLDGSDEVLVVAPVMTDVEASGGGSSSYSRLPKGNVDVTGQYFVWTSNMGTGRQDLFIVRIPSKVLKG